VPSLESSRILLLGAGKMAQLAASNLAARGAQKVFVANHTPEKARALAGRFGGEAVAFDAVADELARADLVVASTRCPELLIRRRDVERALPHRDGRPLVLLDLSVPRDVDPAIAGLPGCSVFDIDDLADHGAALGFDRARLDAAGAQADTEADAYEAWHRSLDAAPAIASLHRRATKIRAAALARNEARLGRLSAEERRTVEALTAQIVNTLLHEPTVRVKEAAAAGEGRREADALKRLFALDD
jgi:glutamyl-tRNA reductase